MKKIYKILSKPLRIFLLIFIIGDYFKFRRKNKRFQMKLRDINPRLKEKTSVTHFDSHYIYHTAWAARKVKEINPEKHVDISSSLYFSSIVSSFIPLDFYDYRPADLTLSNLKTGKADLVKLPFENESIESLSCMHTIEHVGLGRYGDSIDPDGDIKAINELKRVSKNTGNILFVTPVGKPKIEFNAHRIYSYEQIIDYFKDFSLKEFTLITDDGKYIEKCDPQIVKNQKYGCGCFWFIKK